MDKRVFVFMLAALFLLPVVSSISIEISKKVINDVVIRELDEPAVFEFTIKNSGAGDNFEIYSLVGVDFSPRGTFYIAGGETKIIRVEVTPEKNIKDNFFGYYNFVYKMRGSSGAEEDRLSIRIVRLRDAIEIKTGEIAPDSDRTTISISNKENFNFSKIEAGFSSVFFTLKEDFSLEPLATKDIEVILDKEKMETLSAGPYILETEMKIGDKKEMLESTIKFAEKSSIATEETKSGFFILTHIIEKKNNGNTYSSAQVTIKKNIFSKIFTNFNIPYEKAETKGFSVVYTWQGELRPGQSLKVEARTSWFIPILFIAAIVIIVMLFKKYLASDLVLRKKISHVKTKGGEFALKVSIFVRAKRFVERVNIIDKLPAMLKVYEKFGTIMPDKIDEKNRRLEWNIESLNEHEERVFSYIIYSKIGVVGRFELPLARAAYERNGKVRETASNRVFFISEPKKAI